MAESMTRKTFREIVTPSSSSLRWKEINVNTGASASSLQDIKVPDSCGGYSYFDSGVSQSPVANRFIYWRTSNDVLELVEQSLNYNLVGSQVRYKFQGTQILGGISIKESHGSVIILVPTVASVHRLIFPHPANLQRTDIGYASSQPVASIFYDASLVTVTDPRNMHMLNPGGSITSHLHSAATFLTSDGEGLFAFSSDAGNILLIIMPPPDIQGIVQQFDLRQSSMMQKLFSGLIRGGQEASDAAVSLIIHPFHGDNYIFSVCRDYKLRIWSTRTRECIQAFNLLEYCQDIQTTAGGGHTIKKVLNSDAGDLRLCIYLNVPNKNQFCFVQPRLVSGNMEIFHNATVLGTPEDLVDYTSTDEYLWTLSTSQTGESVARVRNLNGATWQDVLLQPLEASEIFVPPHSDPREIYMSRIFHPRRFSTLDIQKALNVYRRSLDSTTIGDASLPISSLKEEVTLAVEDAIRTAASANELAEEEYYQIQLDQWTKFHSCCVQYQEVAAKMKGLFTDPVTELVCFIKKGGLTYVRPCDRIEELYLGSGQWPDLTDREEMDDDLRFDVKTLGRCLDMLRFKVSEETAAQFEDRLLLAQEDVVLLVKDLTDEFFDMGMESSSFMESLGALIHTINELPASIRQILDAMDLSDMEQNDISMDDSEVNVTHQLTCGHLFTSHTAMEVLAASLQQISTTRFLALRDLLFLQTIVSNLGAKEGVYPDLRNDLRMNLFPQTVAMARSYLALKYVSEALAAPTQTNSLEFNVRQLASLEINDTSGLTAQQRAGMQNMGLAELFIQGTGGTNARLLLAQTKALDEDLSPTWSIAVLGLTKFIASLIWPMNPSFMFPEFLVGSCQYIHLQEYVRLLSNWCEWHPNSCKFMLGLCYLHFDEPQKAAQRFIEAKQGISHEIFLRNRLLQTDEMDIKQLDVLYYLKVLKQFEEFDAPDVVVFLAKTAIGDAPKDDKNLPTLWSKVFKHQLDLGHNDDAYNAMIFNPDPSRVKDSLRQLLVTLCDRGDLDSLIKFPYANIEQEVVSILESRARAVDLTSHNYYDLLYAFHVYKNNYRKAGTIMYEQGMRLGREVPGRGGLERQAQCYLAAINVLHIIKPEYAWIVKPVLVKHRPLSDMEDQENSVHQIYMEEDKSITKMEILELQDIEKELMLVDARLRLIQKETDIDMSLGPTPGADEMIGLLVKSGMYDRAISISKVFGLKLFPVFESLALRCVNLARSSTWDDSVVSVTWDWLLENNISLSHIKNASSATDTAWTLLQYYLQKYDDTCGQYHKCTAIKLLSHSFPLPTWLVSTYKGLNFPELLKIYIDFDLLEDSVILTMEYVDAVMDSFTGQDSDLFNIKGCLQTTNRAQTSWLPYTSIDMLLLALRDQQHDLVYGRLYEALEVKMDVYSRKVQDLSDQVCQT